MATLIESSEKSKKAEATGKNGFIFEERIGRTLNHLKTAMLIDSDDWIILIHTEQQIRDFFKEQSLNGVDHMIQMNMCE